MRDSRGASDLHEISQVVRRQVVGGSQFSQTQPSSREESNQLNKVQDRAVDLPDQAGSGVESSENSEGLDAD